MFAEDEIARVPAGWLLRHAPAPRPAAAPLGALLAGALARPHGPSLASLTAGARRVAVILSDASRDEPRAAFLEAIAAVVPRARLHVVIASGTHAPGGADIVPEGWRDLPVTVHDGADAAAMVELGVTPEGTRVRLARALVEADVVVTTGRLRPHYFAGYSGGAKGIFPGCAHREDALHNHLLKADPSARLGRVDGNRCRADMEAAARLLPVPAFALNVLSDVDGAPVAAAAGDLVAAHRALAVHADACFSVSAPRAPVVVVADQPPVSRSLYQASKCLPPAAALLEPGGTVILVAECDEGLGPTERVNEGIYRLGMAAQLAPGHRVVLVSRRSPAEVATSYAAWAPELRTALAEAFARHAVAQAPLLWRAGECVAHPAPSA